MCKKQSSRKLYVHNSSFVIILYLLFYYGFILFAFCFVLQDPIGTMGKFVNNAPHYLKGIAVLGHKEVINLEE